MGSTRLYKTALLAAVSLLALTACQPNGARDEAAAASLTRETPVDGELTTHSPINMNDGSRYEVVPVRLAANQTTRIALDGALRGRLTLFRDGRVVAASGQSCCDEGRDAPYVIVRSDADGDYQLGVSGLDINSYGPFRVTASASDARNGGALTTAETVTGWLNGLAASRAAASHVYDVTVEQAGPYEFTLRSDEFDAHLALSGGGLKVENDDGAGGSDARLTVFLKPGGYRLKAAALGGQATGMYTLASATPQVPAGTKFQSGGALALDTEVAGILMQETISTWVRSSSMRC